MRIYVASSWRNAHQPWIVDGLRSLGLNVYDFRNPPERAGFAWKQVCDEPGREWTGDVLREVLKHPDACAGYAADIGALRACDVCVMVLPCGRSANWEFGYAMGQGKRGIVVQLEPQEPELMYSEATIVTSWAELRACFEAPL